MDNQADLDLDNLRDHKQSTMDGIFLSRSQILLLQTEIFSLFKSLEAFNELNWDDVYKIF